MHTRVSVHLHIEPCVKLLSYGCQCNKGAAEMCQTCRLKLAVLQMALTSCRIHNRQSQAQNIQKSTWGQTAKDKLLQQLLTKLPLTQLPHTRPYLVFSVLLLLLELTSPSALPTCKHMLQTIPIIAFDIKTIRGTHASCCALCASQLDLRQQPASQPADTHMV